MKNSQLDKLRVSKTLSLLFNYRNTKLNYFNFIQPDDHVISYNYLIEIISEKNLNPFKRYRYFWSLKLKDFGTV